MNGGLEETVGNVGELETSGVEMELTWLPPVDGLMFGLNVGYLDTDVKEYKSGDDDIADQTAIGFAPEWTAQGRVQWDIDVADYGYITLGTDLSYRDESYTNSPVDPGGSFTAATASSGISTPSGLGTISTSTPSGRRERK